MRSSLSFAFCASRWLSIYYYQSSYESQTTRPFPLTCTQDFTVVRYADDTLIIISDDESKLIYLKNLLLKFGRPIGLKVNYGKSSLVPINIPEDRVYLFFEALQCQQGNLKVHGALILIPHCPSVGIYNLWSKMYRSSYNFRKCLMRVPILSILENDTSQWLVKPA
jgi:hypothetical protein